jgi:hypothetical protein
LRVEANVFLNDWRKQGCCLGAIRPGTRRPAAEPDDWHGHLAVAIGTEWLLDATLDQAELAPGPIAFRPPSEFWTRGRQAILSGPEIEIRYYRHPRQVGFKHAGDARPSHWRPLAEAIMAGWQRDLARAELMIINTDKPY